jgi:hypothetical protein
MLTGGFDAGGRGGPRRVGDWLEGGAGDDELEGDGRMYGHDRGESDRLEGGAGKDHLYGDAQVVGDRFLHAIDVRGGDDLLAGGAGDDHLWGDFGINTGGTVTGGADRFVFASGSDHDTIGDFQPDQDKVDLSGYRRIDSFAEVRTHSSRSGADTVIDLGAAAGGAAGADVLTLIGIQIAALDAGDFLFA